MKGICFALLLTACAVTAMSPMRPDAGDNVCHLTAESGMCMAYMPRYHYDPSTGDCERFIYGGCGGNGNNYRTKQECLSNCGAAVGDLCAMNADSGVCMAYMPKFFYNSTSRTCEKFIYGGCGGNANKFDTQEDCQMECQQQQTTVAPPPPEQDVCMMPSDTGMCRGFFPKYFYNSKTGACEEFIYGGCGGNDNNFETQEECQSQCAKAPAAAAVCQMPSEPGMCRGFFPKYFYNSNTGACEEFIYGGCGGNDNKFDTQEECQSQCAMAVSKAVCVMPSEPGMCRGYFPKYFYNSDTGACETFIYGGCGGNDNKFDTQEECQSACA